MSFASGQQQLPPGTQVKLVAADGEGNQTPIAQSGDPSVTANPPAQATPGQQTQPPQQQPTPTEPEDKKKEPQVAKPKPKPAPKRTNRPPSKDAVLSRARRLQRADRKKIWEAMGWGSEDEPFSDELFEQKMGGIQVDREKGMSDVERATGKAQTLEQEKAQWFAEKTQMQGELTKARREMQQMHRQSKNEKIERDLRDKARAAGFKDTDYALYRLKKHAVEDVPDGQEPDVDVFFGDLKKDPSNKHLFHEQDVPAGPQPVGDNQQPQQQQQQAQPQGAPQGQQDNNPPGAPPRPAPTGPAGNQIPNALEMNDKDYREHLRTNYQYTPGRG